MKKQKKNKFSKMIVTIISLLIGALLGAFLGSRMSDDTSLEIFLYELLAVLIAGYIQIIIHEAGHLIFGFISGYRFISFRIGNFMWMQENGKLRVKRLKIVGTGGQCLMAPP
ncbi:MAG: hypothetical protein R3Y54_10315 [Eubacteriales bacterium]